MTTRKFGRRLGYDRFHTQTIDPADNGVMNGQKIHLISGIFTPDPVPGLAEVANLAHYKGMLGYLAFWVDGWSTVEGSATIVGPGIAFTAFHVLEDLIDPIMSGELHLALFTPTADGGRAWRIISIHHVHGTDIAILMLSLGSKMPNRRTLNQAMITTRTPAEGELVMISGFRAATDIVPAESDTYFPATTNWMKHGLRLFRSVGTVLKEDDSKGFMLQVDAKTVGGMSGGAAFDKNGFYLGPLSSSVDHGGGEGTSRIQRGWLALGTEVPDAFLNPGQTGRLFEMPWISIDGRENLKVERDLFTGLMKLELQTRAPYAIELPSR